MAHGQGNAEICRDGSPSLTCNHEAPIAFMAGQGAKAGSIAASDKVCPTIRSAESGTNRTPCVAFQPKASVSQSMNPSEICPTIRTTKEPAVCFAENSRSEVRLEGGSGERTGALNTGGGKPGQGLPCVASGTIVRRLTPMECERLQGFPDNYTRIPWRATMAKGPSYEAELLKRGKKLREPTVDKCPDGPRYKALGNSMAVPVLRWLGRRIQTWEEIRNK